MRPNLTTILDKAISNLDADLVKLYSQKQQPAMRLPILRKLLLQILISEDAQKNPNENSDIRITFF